MAGVKSTAYTIDTSDVVPCLRALQTVDRELRLNSNRRLREAASRCAEGLVAALRSAAGGAATPQARIVAGSVRVKRDRVPAVSIGGSRRVGHRGTAAGALVWGSERGGRNFAAPRGGAYWLAPTVRSYSAGPAVDAYKAAVVGVLADAGLL